MNDAPTAERDAFEVVPGEPLVSVVSVLENDFDTEGSALTAVLLSGPANGSLTLSSDGQFVYQPNPGFAGVDTFTYLSTDGSLSSEGLVEIAVAAVVNPADLEVEPPVIPDGPQVSNSPVDLTPETNENTESEEDDTEANENAVFLLPKTLSLIHI